MLRKLLLPWKNKFVVLIVIIVGYFLCITITSLMVNELVLSEKQTNNDNYGGKENYSVVYVSNATGTDFKGNPIEVINEFSKYGKVDVLKLDKETVSFDKNSVAASICPTSFVGKTDWTPLLGSGRYFTPEESSKGSAFVLVGRKIASNLRLKVDDSIEFYGKEYKVIGIMGRDNMYSNWDDIISIPLKALPEDYLNILKTKLVELSSGSNKLKLQMIYRVQQSQYEKVKNEILSNLNYSSLTIKKTESGFAPSLLADQAPQTILILIPIILTALFNVINISFFWITDRKKEITIKKALGATNKSIISAVRLELLAIGLVATILSFIVQVLLESTFESFLFRMGLSLEFSWITFTICTLMSLGIGYLTTILPADKILSMEPAEALRYE